MTKGLDTKHGLDTKALQRGFDETHERQIQVISTLLKNHQIPENGPLALELSEILEKSKQQIQDTTITPAANTILTLSDEIKEADLFRENNPDFVCRVGLDGSLMKTNKAMREYFEIDPSQTNNISGVFSELNPEILERIINDSSDETIVHKTESGEGVKFYKLKIIGIKGYKFAHVYTSDITDEINAIEKVKLAEAFKGQFIDNIGHEVKTPLNAVMGFSEIMKSANLFDRLEAGEHMDINTLKTEIFKLRKYFGYVVKYATKLDEIFKDTFYYSSIMSGNIQKENTPIKISNYLKELFSKYQLETEIGNLDYSLIIDNSLPDVLFLDQQILGKILRSLIDNAIKFNKPNGSVELNISSNTRGSKIVDVTFSVKDTGIGISEASKRLMFDFCQGDGTSTRKHGGLGLGLAISSSLLRALGQERFSVQSELGSGTDISFTVPFEYA